MILQSNMLTLLKILSYISDNSEKKTQCLRSIEFNIK